MEQWKYVKEYSVEVSTEGRIRQDGVYHKVSYLRGYMRSRNKYKQNIPVARAMAIAFLPNPQGLPYIGYEDANNRNIDLENIYWTTPDKKKYALVRYTKELKRRALQELG